MNLHTTFINEATASQRLLEEDNPNILKVESETEVFHRFENLRIEITKKFVIQLCQ